MVNPDADNATAQGKVNPAGVSSDIPASCQQHNVEGIRAVRICLLISMI